MRWARCFVLFCFVVLRSAVYSCEPFLYDDVIKWKHFPRYWPSVRGIHRSPANSPHKGQWRGALMFSLICTRTNDSRGAGDLRRHRPHYDVTVMKNYSLLFHWHCERNTVGPVPVKWYWILNIMGKIGKCLKHKTSANYEYILWGLLYRAFHISMPK